MIKVMDPHADLIVKKFHRTTQNSRRTSTVSTKKEGLSYNHNLKDLEG